MEEVPHRIVYANVSNMDDTCTLVLNMRIDEHPDAHITFRGSTYVCVAAYSTTATAAKEFFDEARKDARDFVNSQQAENAQAVAVDEARALSPTPTRSQPIQDEEENWDSDAHSVKSDVSSVSVWKPAVFTRRFHVNFTGDPEVDAYWEQDRARRERNYRLGLHQHIQNLHYNEHTKRQYEELRRQGIEFQRKFYAERERATTVWQQEDIWRAEAYDDAERAARIREIYKQYMRERALKVDARRRQHLDYVEKNREEEILKLKGENTPAKVTTFEERIEAVLRRHRAERARLCTRERIKAEMEKLAQTVEYRFYTILITNDRELLPEVDKKLKKNTYWLLQDKMHITARMTQKENSRLKYLAEEKIHALHIDEYLTLKRMQGTDTSTWSWEHALANYEQYNVHYGLIIGENDMREGSFRTTRREFAEELFAKYNM